MKKEIKEIEKDLEFVKNIYIKLLTILPSFDITDSKILPYGLKAHTRSVSWLVEQVITQQTKYNAKKLGLDRVNFDFPDTSLHDCEIIYKSKSYFVNVKIHNVESKENKNDISAVEKLYFQYNVNKNYTLIYACFGIKFENIKIEAPLYLAPPGLPSLYPHCHSQFARFRAHFFVQADHVLRISLTIRVRPSEDRASRAG